MDPDELVAADKVGLCVDTNIFHGHPWGKLRDDLQRLKDVAKCEILLPEVVLGEIWYHCTNDEKWLRMPRPSGGLREILREATDLYRGTIETIVTEFLDSIKDISEVLPLCADSAQEGIRRAIDHAPPAKDGEGARDAAIWSAILKWGNEQTSEAESRPPVIFVTDNTTDFNKHPELRSEAKQNRIIPVKRIQEAEKLLEHRMIFFQITQDEEIRPEDPEEIIRRQLTDDLAEDSSFIEFLEGKIDHPYYDTDLEVTYSNCSERSIDIEKDPQVEDLATVYVEESWEIEFSFLCHATVHLGGRDGVDWSNTGTETGRATISLSRTLEVLASEWSIQDDENEYRVVAMEYDESFDPYDFSD